MIYQNKTCVLCATKINAGRHKLCASCYKHYHQYINESWFNELARLQQKQDDIDMQELFEIPYYSATNLYGTSELNIKTPRKDIGRPSTDYRVINYVLDLFDSAIESGNKLPSLRKMTKIVNDYVDNAPAIKDLRTKKNAKLGYVTIRNILLKYRNDQYKLYIKRS